MRRQLAESLPWVQLHCLLWNTQHEALRRLDVAISSLSESDCTKVVVLFKPMNLRLSFKLDYRLQATESLAVCKLTDYHLS